MVWQKCFTGGILPWLETGNDGLGHIDAGILLDTYTDFSIWKRNS